MIRIKCDGHIVDAEITVLQHKTIEPGRFAVGRQDVWKDTQKRALGSSNDGTDGIIVILKAHTVAQIRDYRSNLRFEHSNAKFASGTNWNGEGFGSLFGGALK